VAHTRGVQQQQNGSAAEAGEELDSFVPPASLDWDTQPQGKAANVDPAVTRWEWLRQEYPEVAAPMTLLKSRLHPILLEIEAKLQEVRERKAAADRPKIGPYISPHRLLRSGSSGEERQADFHAPDTRMRIKQRLGEVLRRARAFNDQRFEKRIPDEPLTHPGDPFHFDFGCRPPMAAGKPNGHLK
jgi:hypothetical protein